MELYELDKNDYDEKVTRLKFPHAEHESVVLQQLELHRHNVVEEPQIRTQERDCADPDEGEVPGAVGGVP